MKFGLLGKGGLFAATLFGALGLAGAASADVSDFVGNWVNQDSDTSGVTRMVVTQSGPNRVRVRVFGQCHPSDCDWGEVQAHSYFDAASSNHVKSVMAVFDQGFAKRTIVLRERNGERLQFEILTDFNDGSGRRDYDMSGRLRRQMFGFPGWPPGWPPGLPTPPGPSPTAEDCINFNPATTHAAFVGGAWKLVDGSQWILDFGGNSAAAHEAEDVVDHYQFTQQCFIGRPDPSMTYWKKGNNIPHNGMPGDDCISFNPGSTHVDHVGGAWKIVDGSQWIADFGSNKPEADQAMSIISSYNLNRQCFVARPNPPMTYWLRQ